MFVNKLMFYCTFVFVIFFITWQLHLLVKYNIGFPAIRVDTKGAMIIVGKQSYRFENINAVNIMPEELQPKLYEKFLSKFAAYVHLYTIELYLKNNTIVKFRCNSKAMTDKIISNLPPNVKINY